MNTPLLNSLGVFIMGNTALITHVLLMTALLAVVLAIASGRSVVTVVSLQFAGTLFFILGHILGFRMTLLLVTLLIPFMGFVRGFANDSVKIRFCSSILLSVHAVAIYLVFAGKIGSFQIMRDFSELEVLSLVLFLLALKAYKIGYKYLGAGLMATLCAVSGAYVFMATNSLVMPAFFVALGVAAVIPSNGIKGLFKLAKVETIAFGSASSRIARNSSSADVFPAFAGNAGSAVKVKAVKKLSTNVDQQAIDQAILDQEEFLDRINSQLLANNEDIDSFYGDDILYYQDQEN
jgi:membrane protein